ncbi:MAG TPA: cupredoxin family copper-binding protein [Patescibacteria group bacterium]|jgi:plastocyanin|nr:cupredoxin family copper-binding protein [Patescibacteria group bacterium]
MKKISILFAAIIFLAASCNKTTTQQPEPINQPQSQTQDQPNQNTKDTPSQSPMPTPVPAPTPTPNPAPAPNPTPNPPPASAPATHTVSIENFAFSDASITIKKGDIVIWTNNDSAPHTVTGDSGGPGSSNLSANQTYSFTFNTIGTFNYHCAIHPSMKGVVIVSQ